MKIQLNIALLIISVFTLQGMDTLDVSDTPELLPEIHHIVQKRIKKLTKKIGSRKIGPMEVGFPRVPLENLWALSNFYQLIIKPDFVLDDTTLNILRSRELVNLQGKIPDIIRDAIKQYDEHYKKNYLGTLDTDTFDVQGSYEKVYKDAKETINTLVQDCFYASAVKDFYLNVENPSHELAPPSIQALTPFKLIDENGKVPETLRKAMKTYDKKCQRNSTDSQANSFDEQSILLNAQTTDKFDIQDLSEKMYDEMYKDFCVSIENPSHELTPSSIHTLKPFKLIDENGKIPEELRQAFLKYEESCKDNEVPYIQDIDTLINKFDNTQDQCEKIYKAALEIVTKLKKIGGRENICAANDFYFSIQYPQYALTPPAISILGPLKLIDSSGKVPGAIREAFKKYDTSNKKSDSEHTQVKEKSDEKSTKRKWTSATPVGYK